VPWVQPWAGVSAPLGLPRNAATGRAYSGINILILWCAVEERGFRGQKWLTFRQALSLGAHVRKGEKGTTVVYADRFVPYRERTRAAEAGDEPEAIPFLKRFTGRIALPVILTRPARSTAPTGVPRPRYQYQ
jgi:antirestriction protein ArdC